MKRRKDQSVENHDQYVVKPIGFVRSKLVQLEDAPRQGDEGAPDAWLDFLPDVSPGLSGIHIGNGLVVLSWLHLSSRHVLQVHPRGNLELPLTGVFATRSPDRPNPIGVHHVTVLQISKNAVRVSPLEAVHGTPVLDVKPVLLPAPDRIQASTVKLRSATLEDVHAITDLIRKAYSQYVNRIGMTPRPMTDNYADVVRDYQVTVAESNGIPAGIIVLGETEEGYVIDNLAVHPSYRNRGIGKLLLEFAETQAKQAGYGSIYLYTHEKMLENQALYSRVGYVQYDRRSRGSFSLIYMRKYL